MYEDCPPAELEICCWYEYDREGCRLDAEQLQLFPDRTGELILLPLDPPRGEIWIQKGLYPEWPQEPYLSIPAVERETRLKRLQGGSADYVRSRRLMPAFPRGYLTPEHAKVYLEGFRILELSEDLKGRQTLGPKHDWPIREISDASWVAPFLIDWRRSDSEILDDFSAWLKEHRPEAFPSPKGERGAGNYARRLQADLKVLGALRLLEFYKQWQDIPQEMAIYEDPSSWMTAHQKAKIRLKFFRLWEPNG
jgi:hypothetical protein